jgi:phage shock protein E
MKPIVITVSVLLLIYISYRTYRIFTLDKGLNKMVAKGAVILDVRTVKEFNTGHINGAINIPLSKLHEATIPLEKSSTIITCCSHGLRSVKAVSLLKEHGYKKVFNGGAWTDLQTSIR